MTHETRLARTFRSALAAAVLTLTLAHVAAAADEHLADPKLAKAVAACQGVIIGAEQKALATKLRALDACANIALSCFETKTDDPKCTPKAASVCAKQLNAAATALGKAQAKIASAKSCAASLRLPDLLAPDGLGLGDLAGACQADFGIDVCTDVAALASCVTRTSDHAAGALYGEARPRTGEILALLPTIALPPVAGLPTFPGCFSCGAPPDQRKALESCGKAITKAHATLLGALDKSFVACAAKVLACVETKTGDSKCLAAASTSCDKSAATIDGFIAKFAGAIAKKCDASLVPFATLADPSGLNVAAIAARCAAAPTDAASLAACLGTRARCATAELARDAVPRTDAFADDDHLGAFGADLTAECPSAVSERAAGAPRTISGSIVQFLAEVHRPTGNVAGVRVDGAPPAPNLGIGRNVTNVTGPTRVAFGGDGTIHFHYRATFPSSRDAAERLLVPPTLIIAVQRADAALDDHFEVDLDPAGGATDVDDEIDVTYADPIPSCAFTIALATRIGGVVSAYTRILQVVDSAAAPTPTPTAANPTPTATLSAGGPTATPTHTPTRTPSPTPTATAAGNIAQILDTTGDGTHALSDPQDIAVDSVGNVYVTGANSDNVFKIAPRGAITQIMDATGDGTHALDRPFGLGIDPSNDDVYVTGAQSNNVFKITPGGVITQVIDATGIGVHALAFPTHVAIDHNHVVYVAASQSSDVFRIGATTTVVIGLPGDGTHALDTPRGLAIDASNNVYVGGNISNNAFEISSGGSITQIIDHTGDGTHALTEPFNLAVDAGGNAYVPGELSVNVFKVPAGGGAVTQVLDATGDGVHPINSVEDVALDGSSFLYATANLTVLKIPLGSGAKTQIIDATGDGIHNLSGTVAIAVDGNGVVYVLGRSSQNAFKVTP